MTSSSSPMRILVTGSSGLVGSGLRAKWGGTGIDVVELDLVDGCDVRDPETVKSRIAGCDGVVHLAAISRVVWAEDDPDTAWSTNVEGTRTVLEAARAMKRPPWLLFASSREVYGRRDGAPTPEDAPLAPLNVYGRAKVAGEAMMREAREHGLVTGIVRLSNVYGSTADHADRVVPAFAAAAVAGTPLRVDGRDHAFDFTHLSDTVKGLDGLVERLHAGDVLPPIHLATGTSTSLGALAELAIRCAGSASSVVEAPPRSFDVDRFRGDPARAASLLGWRAAVGIEEGMAALVDAFRRG